MNYILLIVGFFLLVKGADYFVDGSSNIAKTLKIPPIIIGLTIVAFGTSAPEAAVSITASLDGQNGMAMGNVLGSNIFNLLMVVGAAGFIKTLHVEKSILSKEFPFLLLASILMIVLSADMILTHSTTNMLSRFDGLILLILFVGFVYYLIKMALKARNISLEETSISIDADVVVSTLEQPISKSIIYSICGMVAIIFGGKLVVSSASYIASTFGVSDQLIGLTVVAIGTSLPEFVTSIIAATKGESDIALGNVIGSNMFNILFVLGISAFISPMAIEPKLIIDGIFMIIVTCLTYFFAIKRKDVNKAESLILIGLYLSYMTYLIMTA
ncbi:calcium/sodium antiporter [Romboutsia sp.]|uniref:calcium/sodium antiporter n=1 Tax=Romboutsia sp. TaxID=1965302 RepID=UPI002CA49E64|nr:calcium/sodium antiporter [Romboutsia sp.]HSQ89602.1 calcium/sodium antiporter [Romboutsia sp.]